MWSTGGQRLDYYPGCWYEIGVAKKRESNACALTLIAENIFESFARKKKLAGNRWSVIATILQLTTATVYQEGLESSHAVS